MAHHSTGRHPALLQNRTSAFARYGSSATDIARTLNSLRTNTADAEIELWNRVLTSPNPTFNTEPNAFKKCRARFGFFPADFA